MQKSIIVTLPDNVNILENLFFPSIDEEQTIIPRYIIPQELITEILSYLDLKQLNSLNRTNRVWHYQISQYSQFAISKVLSAALPHLLGIQEATLEEDLFASYSVPSDAWTILKTFAKDPADEDELEKLSEDPIIWGKVQMELEKISYSLFFHYEIEIHQDSIQLNSKDIKDLTENIKQKESLNKSLFNIPQSLHGTKFKVRAFYDKIVKSHPAYGEKFSFSQFLLRLNRVELLTEEPSSSVVSLNSSSNDLLKSQESSKTSPNILQPAFDRFNETCQDLNTAADNLYCQQLEKGEIRLFEPSMIVFRPLPNMLHLEDIVEALIPLIQQDQQNLRNLDEKLCLDTWLFSEEGLSLLLDIWILIKDPSYFFNTSELNNTFVDSYQEQYPHLPLENIQEKLRLTLSYLSACESFYTMFSMVCLTYSDFNDFYKSKKLITPSYRVFEYNVDRFRPIHYAWMLLQKNAPSSAIKGNTVGLNFVISKIINFLKPLSQDASEHGSNQEWDSRWLYQWG